MDNHHYLKLFFLTNILKIIVVIIFKHCLYTKFNCNSNYYYLHFAEVFNFHRNLNILIN